MERFGWGGRLLATSIIDWQNWWLKVNKIRGQYRLRVINDVEEWSTDRIGLHADAKQCQVAIHGKVHRGLAESAHPLLHLLSIPPFSLLPPPPPPSFSAPPPPPLLLSGRVISWVVDNRLNSKNEETNGESEVQVTSGPLPLARQREVNQTDCQPDKHQKERKRTVE